MQSLRNSFSRILNKNLMVLAIVAVSLAAAATAPAQRQTTNPAPRAPATTDPVVELVKKVSASVVQIQVTAYGPTESGESGNASIVFGRQNVIGSGFVIDPSGYILTNAHVVKAAELVQVTFPAPEEENPAASALSLKTKTVSARVVGISKENDVALLKVELTSLPALPLANYRDLQQGEAVYAFGSPEGLRNSVTHGIVSAVARQADPDSGMLFIQTDTPINPGNSGGPLVNSRGEVVGMNTFILTQSGGNEGLGFAIPSAILSLAADQLKKFGHMHRVETGFSMQTVTPTMAAGLRLARSYGVIVSDVPPGSPAIAAGLRVGDIILSVNALQAENLPRISYLILTLQGDDIIHMNVLRGTQQIALDVPVKEPKHQIDEMQSLADPSKNLVRDLGIIGLDVDAKVKALVDDLRDDFGVIVLAKAAGASMEVPLSAGDVIRSVNGNPVGSVGFLNASLKALADGAPVVLQIQRDTKLSFVAFTLERR
jgi:serine protease Do